MKAEIKKIILKIIGEDAPIFSVETPTEKSHGDYSTNVAMVLSKKLKKSPKEVAEYIKEKIGENKLFEKIEIAGPGFINFFISKKIFFDNLKRVDKNYGRGEGLKNKKVIIDYTDPNPFKEFHIGHLMSNAIGESLSRIYEFCGAKVKRVCYQGDVGIHVAKAIYGKFKNPSLDWGGCYAFGAEKFESDEGAKREIIELNKKIYNRSDKEINRLYDEGKKDSLQYFSQIYKKLGTNFDFFIFESETGLLGKKVVEKGLKEGVFEKGENGAIIYKGEKFGLHTRVFINSEGLPTYEAKDLGLAEIKNKKFRYDKSVVVTGNEVNDYFKVMLSAMSQVLPELAKKTTHIGHGMLRLPEGKMSSRTGKVITAESLIGKVSDMIAEKIKDKSFSELELKDILQSVSIGAIKYSILKQSSGSDVIYDFDKSISFEGDSGPYLQYAYTRAKSVLEKAKKEGIKESLKNLPENSGEIEKNILRFPEVVSYACENNDPHFVTLYLTELAGDFNNYYAKNKIVDIEDKLSSYKVFLTKAFMQVMENGLWVLGIKTLNKM